MLNENKKAISRRGFLKLSSMAVTAAALAACAPPPAGNAPAANSGGAAAPAAQGATVAYWYNWNNLDPALVKIIETDEWKQIMGDTKLEYKGSVNDQALLTAIAGGAPPDCQSNHPYFDLFTRGAAIPVQDMVSASTYVKKEKMFDWVWNYCFYEGQMIGVPGIESYVQWGLNYNTDAAQKVGLDPKAPPATWAETLDWHKKLTKKDAAGNLLEMGLDPGDAMGGDVDYGAASYGVTWYDEKTKEFKLDDERVAAYLDMAGQFIKFAGPDQFAGMRQVQGNGTWGTAYESGVQMMIIEGYWHPGETMHHKPEVGKFNQASWGPQSDDRKNVKMQAVNSHFVQILKDGKNPTGSFKLGEVFNTVKACDIIFKEVGWIHPLKEFIPTVDANAYPGLKFYVDSEKEATEWHLIRRCPIHWFVKTQLDELRDKVARDLMKPADAAAELQKRAVEEFKNQGLKK